MNKLAFPDFPVPNYTTLCHRTQDINAVLLVLRSGEPKQDEAPNGDESGPQDAVCFGVKPAPK